MGVDANADSPEGLGVVTDRGTGVCDRLTPTRSALAALKAIKPPWPGSVVRSRSELR
jgi:hypothetical protein